MTTLLKIKFTIPEGFADDASVFIASKVPHGWEETQLEHVRRFTLYLEDHPLGMDLVNEFKAHFPDSDVTYVEQESEDWTLAWKEFFNPVNCGETFKILPPWFEGGEETGATHIVIEPKMAFGTGHHPTTSLCLETIGKLAKKNIIKAGQDFLDLGTGSGILAIGLCKLGLSGTALDIDPLAIECTVENVKTNEVSDAVDLAVGSINCLDNNHKFEIVVANILSGPLIEMAVDIVSHVKPSGSLILSGILAEKQANSVVDAYEKLGIGPAQRFVSGEWVCLVWEKIG